MARSLKFLLLILVAGTLALAGCSKKGPEPISFGSDNCAGCGMTASDAQFGAEIVTAKGKILKFDSVECMAGYLNNKGTGGDVASLWVVDFSHPSQLVDANTAFFLASDKLHSPMGLGLAAFKERSAAASLQGQYPGTIMGWTDVLRYVGQKRN